MESGNIENAFINYAYIGMAYFRLGDFTRAQDSISKVIEYTKQISFEKVLVFRNANFVNALSNFGNKSSVIEYFLFTLEVEQKYGCDKTSVKILDVMDRFLGGTGDGHKHTLLSNNND